MMALFIAESQRFVARRVTRFFPLVLATLIMAGFVIAYFVIESEGTSPDFVDIAGFGDGGSGFEPEQPEHRTGILGPMGLLLQIMAFTLGASFFGADQKAGVIELLLTWRPKRVNLLAARAVGGSIITAALAMMLSSLVIAGLYVLSSIFGTTAGMTGEMWGWLIQTVIRSGIVAGLFFVIGLGLTVLLNNSTASIISFMIYAFVVENLLELFVSAIGPYLPMTNASAFVDGGNVFRSDFFDDGLPVYHHGYLTAGVIVAGLALVSMAVGAVVFQRRDIA